MALAVVTIKIMPDSPESDLDKIKLEIDGLVKEFAGKGDTKVEIEPIAFGLKCINYTFIMDEKLGSPDVLSEKVAVIKGVASAEVSDVRRAIG